MSLKTEIEKINKTEIEKVFNNLIKSGIKAKLDKKRKYIFTIKKFEVFLRLYVDKNIQVCIRTNTINSKETVIYDFVNFDDIKVEDIEEYKKNIRAFLKNIVKEAINTTYCPEYRNEMIPSNASQEEIDANWCLIYEKRLLKKLDYSNVEDFKEWLEKVTDKKYIKQQKSF